MPKEHRLAFLVIEAEPAQGLSTRKLLLESAKHNVVTAYSPQEGLAMFRRFPNVDAVAMDGGFGSESCSSLAREIKALNPKVQLVALLPIEGRQCAWADETISSHDPAGLLRLLRELGGGTKMT